jgi:hypothetical protein
VSTLSTGARNDACDAATARVDNGASFGKLKIKAGGTLLATIVLSDPAYGAAAAGVATGAGFPKNVAAVGAGTADNYEITDSDDNVEISGTAGAAGTEDLVLDNAVIAIGQNVIVSSLTHTQPAS